MVDRALLKLSKSLIGFLEVSWANGHFLSGGEHGYLAYTVGFSPEDL